MKELLTPRSANARREIDLTALALGDEVLPNPYSADFTANRAPLIDRSLYDGQRFRLYTTMPTMPRDYADALTSLSIVAQHLFRFRAMPELWAREDDPEQLALAARIALALDEQRYEIFDPKMMAASYFQPSAERIREILLKA